MNETNPWEAQEIAFIESPLIAKAIKLRGYDARSFVRAPDESSELFDLCMGAYVYAADYHSGQWSDAYALHSYLNALRFSPGMGFSSSSFFPGDDENFEYGEAKEWLVFIAQADGIKINWENGEIE